MTRTEHVALKGTRDGLVLYLDPAADFKLLIDELDNLMKNSDQFLQGATLRCYAGKREFSEDELSSLAAVLKQYRLEIAGWMTPEEVYHPGKAKPSMAEERARLREEGMVEGHCLLIERTLRSGKSVQYEGHVVVLGDVNPGAEIIATGNIVVLGSLRGVAHAGATGDRTATVSAYHLAPTQLRIADFVTRAPDDEADGRGPEIARIKDDQLMVEAAGMSGWRSKAR
ncbi:septum site-determining protein MinC [Desulfosporosinus orientis DSM 765]|uniref:Probable septum site-determining protein MinC n=1 Tax=Desulfosporosinus orientis (strain ATCC 19365 / DSM 765 / NCIMB 8382 / VKM B-1628 / Singapore I) TaxID=768706 RepID=G7W785_DESOD|nr:septum site-determining protein MinC [Desulfosporosinus orientis]AET70593.1 septum site-determining protein MinC [Desulfosporosinus orientis DSM 765]